jgi:hypothetical protein
MCGVFCTTSPRCVLLFVFSTLHLGFTPRASLYFTVRLIVVISSCSILLHNLITIRKKFVVGLISIFLV